MNILVINSGSSSIKFQLMAMPEARLICEGLVERIGQEEAVFHVKKEDETLQEVLRVTDHRAGLKKMAEFLLDPSIGVIADTGDLAAVGHRVVHGGDRFSTTTRITGKVKEEIRAFIPLAPLHNPHNLEGIEIAEEVFPDAVQVAVFDTAFHQSMPLTARKYAIPEYLFRDYGIKVYGFHGISHKYVTERALEYLNLSHSRIISIHLGNGCSMTAVQDGKSLDHSLGFAPGNGLIMGSRSGDIDHALIFYLTEHLGYATEDIRRMLTRESGMLGLTGLSDMRDIQAKAEEGDASCRLALQMNAYRIRKYIGAYAAVLNGLDAIVFTAGIGENSALIRKLACEGMEYLGLELDPERNTAPAKGICEIHAVSSRVRILIVPTNEELEIAREVFLLLNNGNK